MRHWLTKSVGFKVIAGTMTFLAIAALISGAYNLKTQESSLLVALTRQGRGLAELAAIATAESCVGRDIPVMNSVIESLTAENSTVRYVEVLDKDKEILRAVGNPEINEGIRVFEAPIFLPPEPGEEVLPKDQRMVCGTLRLHLSNAQVVALVERTQKDLLLQTGATFVVLALLMLIMLNRMVGQPLQKLDVITNRLGLGELDQPINLRQRDEFGRLASTLDVMRVNLWRSYEEIREQNEKLRELDRLKSDFLANMSHEIRTPMNAILGFTNLLLETRLTEDQEDLAKTALNSAEGLLTILNDILDHSKIESGRMNLETVPMNPREIVDDVLDLLAPDALKKGLGVHAWMDSTLPTTVMGDPFRLRQIITNLVGNAIKFTEKGEVVIRILIDEREGSGKRWRFAVQDTGIGIKAAALPTLFQTFNQVDNSTTREFGGTGLGLSISRGLVELMGGELTVESRWEEGSTFAFDIDLPAAEGVTEKASRARGRALILSAGATSLDAISETVRTLGLTVETESTSEGAIAAIEREREGVRPYGYLLIDRDESTNGLELVRTLRHNDELAPLMVIMIGQGIGSAYLEENCHLLDGVLTKPVRLTQLRRCLERGLGRLPRDPVDPGPEFSLFSKPTKSQRILTDVPTLASGPSGDDAPTAPLAAALPTPSKRAPAPPPNPEVKAPGVLGKPTSERLLLIEDNAVNQKLILRVLERMGYKNVVVAKDGAEGVERASEPGAEFDLVLMDCQMPVMDGYEATRHIRSLPDPMGTVPILAMTANAMNGAREACLEAGMDDYMTKPIQMALVEQAFERWLGARSTAVAGPSNH